MRTPVGDRIGPSARALIAMAVATFTFLGSLYLCSLHHFATACHRDLLGISAVFRRSSRPDLSSSMFTYRMKRSLQINLRERSLTRTLSEEEDPSQNQFPPHEALRGGLGRQRRRRPRTQPWLPEAQGRL